MHLKIRYHKQLQLHLTYNILLTPDLNESRGGSKGVGGKKGGRTSIFSCSQTDVPRPSHWDSSLLSSGDPLRVVSSAIKPSSLFVGHMWSRGEVLMKYEDLSLPQLQSWMCFCSCISAELFTLTPQIPVVTKFPLRTHLLLTRRLTSLTLQHEGVAASMKRWLRGNFSLSLCEILIPN